MKRLFPRIGLESYESQHSAKRYNPASVFYYRDKPIVLSAGRGDSLEFWADGAQIFALCTNARHGYAGLEVFDAKTRERVSDVFSQNVSEEFPGRTDFFDYSPATQRKILAASL